MAISNIHDTQLLTPYTQYAIMSTVDSHKGGIHADNAREILDAQGVSGTLQDIRRVNQEIHQKEATQGYPCRRQFTNCRYCLARVFEQAEQVTSVEAINVKSHCRYGLDNFLRQWLRNKVSLLEIFRVPLCLVYLLFCGLASVGVESVVL